MRKKHLREPLELRLAPISIGLGRLKFFAGVKWAIEDLWGRESNVFNIYSEVIGV
jgi:hypothetical protein